MFSYSGLSCSSCPQLCASCSNAGICTKCLQGYYLSGNQCLTCTAEFCTCSVLQTYLYLYNQGGYLMLSATILLYFLLWVFFSNLINYQASFVLTLLSPAVSGNYLSLFFFAECANIVFLIWQILEYWDKLGFLFMFVILCLFWGAGGVRAVKFGCLLSKSIGIFCLVDVNHELEERLTEGNKSGSIHVYPWTQGSLVVNRF